jgi:site-specific recombinase XerD
MKNILFQDAIELYIEDLIVRRELPKTTIKTYRNTLRRFENFVAQRNVLYLQDVTYLEHALPYKLSLQEKGLSNCTIRAYIMSVRSLFTFAVQQKWVTDNPFAQIITKDGVQKKPNVITRQQLNLVLYQAKNATLYAIYLAGGDAGLRISEILDLEISHLDFENNVLYVNKGKGEKQRIIPMRPRLAKELKDYIEKDRPKFPNSPYVFLMPSGRQVRSNYVNEDLKCISEKYFDVHLTTHMLRHSFATSCYRNGASLMVIRQLLGHKHVQTTERYLHVTDKEVRNAVDGLDD